MDEHAGLHIALGVNMQVIPATGNTAAHVLGIILEVHGEQGLGIAVFPDLMIHMGALLGTGQKLGGCTVAYGHIVEEPGKQSAGIDHVIEEFFAGDILVVDRGIAGGDTESQAMLLQQPHGVCNFIINSLSTAGIVGIFETLQRDGGHKVLHPQHFLTEFFVDEGAVGAPAMASGYFFTDENSPMAAFLHCENIVYDNPGFVK